MSIVNLRDDETTTFTLHGHVSVANALRRTIIKDIETWVFITSPNEENTSVFHTNTSRLNNELLKQRLSCIPIHVKYRIDTLNLAEYYLEVNVENTTDTILSVTTKDFIVKHKETRNPIDEELQRKIFPPFIADDVAYYILFITLRPRISNEIPGEKIHFTCDFSTAYARMSSMFNVTSNCSYGNTIDESRCNIELTKKREEWKLTMTDEEVDLEEANWRLLDAKRIFIPDSFDFQIETVGVFSNYELIQKACEFIVNSFGQLIHEIQNEDGASVRKSLTTIPNAWDIVFDDDYTLGKLIENSFNKLDVTYCGYIKIHPHDYESTLRVAFKDEKTQDDVIDIIVKLIEENMDLFMKLVDKFRN